MEPASGQEIYDNFTKHAQGTAELQDAQAAAQTLANDLPDRAADLKRLQDEMDTSWVGDAADAAQRGIGPLALEHLNVADTLRTTQDLMSRQTGSFHQAANSVRPMPPEPALQDPLTTLVAGQDPAPMLDQVVSYNAAAQHNVDVMNTYYSASTYNTDNMPTMYGRLADNQPQVTVQPTQLAGDPSAGGGPAPGRASKGGTGWTSRSVAPNHTGSASLSSGSPSPVGAGGASQVAGAGGSSGSGSTELSSASDGAGGGSGAGGPDHGGRPPGTGASPGGGGVPVGVGAGPVGGDPGTGGTGGLAGRVGDGSGEEPGPGAGHGGAAAGEQPGGAPDGGVGGRAGSGFGRRSGGVAGGNPGTRAGVGGAPDSEREVPGAGAGARSGLGGVAEEVPPGGLRSGAALRSGGAGGVMEDELGGPGAGMMAGSRGRSERDGEHHRNYEFGPDPETVFVGELPAVAPEAFGESPEQRRARHSRDAAEGQG